MRMKLSTRCLWSNDVRGSPRTIDTPSSSTLLIKRGLIIVSEHLRKQDTLRLSCTCASWNLVLTGLISDRLVQQLQERSRRGCFSLQSCWAPRSYFLSLFLFCKLLKYCHLLYSCFPTAIADMTWKVSVILHHDLNACIAWVVAEKPLSIGSL